jgi:spermidine synthase
MLTLLYAVFVLSGAAGLIYESIWARYLGLFVGHSAYAQVIVLVMFMGGMAIGALLVGERSQRVKSPLLWYAAIELIVGVLGLAFHGVFESVSALSYDSIFPALGAGWSHIAVKWVIAAALILPQSILLGTTFPLMSAGVIRLAPERSGRSLALLYFSNSFGAAVGVLLAGFYLVALAGLPGTLVVAAILNIVVALIVYVAVKRSGAPVAATSASVTEPSLFAETARGSSQLSRWLLLVAFGTAVASFIYEIAWVRMLSLVLGSATHSFELMLSAFILGLALGAYFIRTRVDGGSLRLLALVQLAMGALAIATLPVYLKSFEWMAGAMSVFARTPEGYGAMSVFRYALCLAVMLPATFCAGMTLPVITRMLLAGGDGERAIGRVYGVNTFGSIIGVTLASLVLMPVLGLKWLLVLGGAIDIALGVMLVVVDRRARAWSFSRRAQVVTALASAAVLFILGSAKFDTTTLTSGVFRYGTVQMPGSADVLFYKDGRTATVSVRRIASTGGLSLATNGKPDATLGPVWLNEKIPGASRGPFTHNESTQTLVSLIPLAYVPNAKQAAMIGHGSGMSTHVLLGSPTLERVVSIEIEPEMIRASRLFYPANHRVFDDPRHEFAIDDARAYFAAGRQKYDLIIAEPSNPWVAGVAGLFTAEFYRALTRYLTEGGILAQWVQFTEIDDGLVLSVIAALDRSFASYAMFAVSDHDLLIVASQRPELPAPDWSIVDRFPGVIEDLSRFVPLTAHTFETLRIADHRSLAPLARRAEPNSDYYPVLDLNAERARYTRSSATGFALLGAQSFSVTLAIGGARNGFTDQTQEVAAGIPRLSAAVSGAQLRARSAPRKGGEISAIAFRNDVLKRSLAGPAPVDWRAWVQAMSAVDRDVHGGSAGFADLRFYSALEAFARRHNAPAEARASIDLLRGLGAWDFVRAATAARVLVPAAQRGDLWVDPDMLRDGAVTSYLKLGNQGAARDAFVVLAPHSQRAPNDLRTMLLESLMIPSSEIVSAGLPR